MTDQSFTTTITVDKSPAEVFAAVTDVRGWWGRGIEGSAATTGDEFVFEVPGVHRSDIEIAEVIPDRKVVWRVRENFLGFVRDTTEWTGTEIHFDIAAADGGTELRFTHIGLVPDYECYDACSNGWSFYINESLKDLVTTGTGQPSELPAEIVAREEAARKAAAQA